MKKVLFITNIPAPYRIDFFQELGKKVDLTVLFEAKSASRYGISFNYNFDSITNFTPIFLREDSIREKRIDFSIFKYLKSNKYDAIVATQYSYFTEMAALFYLKFKNIEYYLETDGGFVRSENFLKKRLKRYLISGAKGYFSPSLSADKYLIHYGATPETIVRYPFSSLSNIDIQEGIRLQHKHQQLRSHLGITEDVAILYVGQFIHRKGIDNLLRAFSKIANSSVGLYLVGGKLSDEMISLIPKKMRSRVHCIEFTSKKLLSQYYATCDIFCLPTREDIWGLVVNEAMSFGLPIVTTTHCGAGLELVEQDMNGYLYEPEDVSVLRNYLEKLILDGSLRNRMSMRSFERISVQTTEQMANAHFRTFVGERW